MNSTTTARFVPALPLTRAESADRESIATPFAVIGG